MPAPIFYGENTVNVQLHPQFLKWKPRTIERWRKQAVEHFRRYGHTQHSGLGLTLPFVVNHCEEHKIPYVLRATPGFGYFIELDQQTIEMLEN
jgi:hypothetical protein